MATWEILTNEDNKYTNKAQCPYCDYIVKFITHLPEKCPDCAHTLSYERMHIHMNKEGCC